MINKKELLDYLNNLYPKTECFLKHNHDYELLIAVILSAQTTDKKVNEVTSILFSKYDSLEKLKDASYDDIYQIISILGLAKSKTNYVMDAVNKVYYEYDQKVPDGFDKLITINGVGYKTAKVILGELYNKKVIPVDTHIQRIAKRLELSKSDNPSLISVDLEKKFPDSGINFHRQLILFGRNICKAISPNCKECKLNTNCPYFSKKVK